MAQASMPSASDAGSDAARQQAQDYVAKSVHTARTVTDIPSHIQARPVTKLGVIGAGTMGGGIAMNAANIGIPVTIIETSEDALQRGLERIKSNYLRTASRGRITEAEALERHALIHGSLVLDDLADCDLIIEAVFENMGVKQEIFRKLDRIAHPDAVLASNTSALDINEIAAVTQRPQSVLGLHFFSPANVMKLLEIVRGEKTSPQTLATSLAFAEAIGKVVAVVGVCPGFVGNRILFPRQRQAQALLLEGARPEQVDTVLRDFGMPMGPFQMSDLAGLDIGWNPKESTGLTLRDRLCEAGRRGQKTGAGYYDYDEQRQPQPSPLVAELIDEFVTQAGGEPRTLSEQEILERCLLPMINEGAKILQECIASRASDIDVIWVYGYGWPRYRGGPMYWADSLGLDYIIERLEHYHTQSGDHFWQPAWLLSKLALKGMTFSEYRHGDLCSCRSETT